jgi:hypothetical protein
VPRLKKRGGVGRGQKRSRAVEEDWAWGHFRLAEAYMRCGELGLPPPPVPPVGAGVGSGSSSEDANGSFWARAVRAATAAAAASAKAAASSSSRSGKTCVVIGGGGAGKKFAELAAKALAAAEANLDPLDMVTIRMEADAAAALAESEAKEKVRAAAMAGKTIDIDENKVDLGFTYNPAAHCFICKQRGHTKVCLFLQRNTWMEWMDGMDGWIWYCLYSMAHLNNIIINQLLLPRNATRHGTTPHRCNVRCASATTASRSGTSAATVRS